MMSSIRSIHDTVVPGLKPASKRIMPHSLASKLGLSILLLSVPIFVASLGLLFNQSRHMIREEAVGRANSVLSTKMQHICRKLNAIETATNANSRFVLQYLQPDSLLSLSHKVVYYNPNVDGCSISTEPFIFPEYGRYFSAYSIREGDSIPTVVEEPYEYFEKAWYKTPREQQKSCWVNFYDETDSLKVTLDGMIASYCKPIYNADGHLIAIMSTDISLQRLSKNITEERPYPNSFFMMIDQEGRYFIHPDTTRLFKQTIFSHANPRLHADIIALGHEMTEGKKGYMAAVIEGEPCMVCYQPVPGTTWSMAIVCPDSDILKPYHQQVYILVPLLIFGLIAILLLCHRVVGHAIHPIDELLVKTQCIAEGNMEVYIPHSQRTDAVGRLQNSFATMLQSLHFHMGSVRYSTEQAQLRNEELNKATLLALEADKQKTAFIQNVSHQIRTPLNIIMGFAQILNDSASTPDGNTILSDEEMKSITETMSHNSQLLSRLVLMLFDSSETGLTEELLATAKHDKVPCNDVAREAISYINLHYPSLSIKLETEVPDDFSIQTNRLYLMRSLREILYNSAKYSDGQHVVIRVLTGEKKPESQDATEGAKATPVVRFIIEDTGKGIAESDHERMFKFFTKIDDLSEGLGLGLPLAKRHARNLGGDLTLDADYHDGCRFIIEIPQFTA